MRKLIRSIPILLAVVLIAGCASTPVDRVAFNSIDDATSAVQSAVRAYKTHCGVASGQHGPGTCAAAEYAQAEATYAKFQSAALAANDIASRTGQTPLAVISSAAAEALALFASMKGGQ